MDEYGKKLIEQSACEERKAIIKVLENMVWEEMNVGTYGRGCPSIERAIEYIKGRDKKLGERTRIVEELRDHLEKIQGFPSNDHGTQMWRRGWQDAADWIEQRRDE